MAGKDMTENELWAALQRLDDDLLDPKLPDAAIDSELRAMGVDPAALASRGIAFVAKVKEEERLSWQTQAKDLRDHLARRASRAVVPDDMDRQAVLQRLEELRSQDSNVGTAIKMAARKRKPEESTVEELRALLAEMEALRSIESDDVE